MHHIPKSLLKTIKWFVDSHIYIAGMVVLLIKASIHATDGNQLMTLYIIFCFIGTWVIYTLHQIFGHYVRAQNYAWPGVKKVGILLFVAGLTSCILFIPLISTLKYNLWVPLIISGLYVLPFKYRRLRDIQYVKIFLIAFAWAWLSATNVQLLEHHHGTINYIAVLERFLFILGITIPFDIRDYQIDKKDGLKTLVSLLGIVTSKRLSVVILVITAGLSAYLFVTGWQSLIMTIAFISTYIVSSILCMYAEPYMPKLYYTALLDGMMGLPWLIMLL